jgi:F-type H+-transporting ATPase subunit a
MNLFNIVIPFIQSQADSTRQALSSGRIPFQPGQPVDTLHHLARVAEQGGGEHGGIGGTIIHHIRDSRVIELPFLGEVHLPQWEPMRILGLSVDLSPTRAVVMMWVVALLLLTIFIFVARSYKKSIIPHGISNFMEALILFIRDEVAIPNMGDQLGKAFTPYLLSLFFFILFCNLLGLVPYAATATGSVSVTGALALLTFILTQAMGIKKNGLKGYLIHLTGGVHWTLWPIMVPVEFMGLFTKPFALTIRLFANMTAGHVIVLSLLSLIFVFKTLAIAPVSIAFSLFIYCLELFVGFLQAYVFVMLSSLFIGMAAASGHSDESEHH